MALSFTVTADPANARVALGVSGQDRVDSDVVIRRRTPPTWRELSSEAFIPHAERYALLTIIDEPLGNLGRTLYDYQARAGARYQYQARERYANGTLRPWTSWQPNLA